MTHSLFKPLRRELGVLSLVIALVLMMGWIRSRDLQDTIVLSKTADRTIKLVSACQRLAFVRTKVVDPPVSFKTPLWKTHKVNREWWHLTIDDATCPHDARSFSFSRARFQIGSAHYSARIFQLPYWSVVVPLTLLSAWLLLMRSREANAEPEAHIEPSNKVSSHETNHHHIQRRVDLKPGSPRQIPEKNSVS